MLKQYAVSRTIPITVLPLTKEEEEEEEEAMSNLLLCFIPGSGPLS